MNIFRQTLAQVVGTANIVGRFNFKHHRTAALGDIFRPEIEISVWSNKYQEWQRFSVLIDTGADYSIMPRYVASLLGIPLQKKFLKPTSGIGGVQNVYFIPDIKVKIGKAERIIPVGFVDNNQVPPLFGRQAALETFSILFDHRKSIFFAE